MPEFQCPSCSGEGRQFVHLNSRDPMKHGFQWIDCMRCGGAKWISEEAYAAYLQGIRLKEDRKARRVSLREEAKRLGISAVELSRRERGHILTGGSE